MSLVRTLIKLFLTVQLVAIVSSLAMAQSIPIPEDGKTWKLSMYDESYDRNVYGTVRYINGQYEIEISSFEAKGIKGQLPITSKIQSTEVSANHRRISIKKPKLVTRGTLFPGDFLATYDGTDGIASVAEEAEDINRYIKNPDLKVGGFLDGKPISEDELNSYYEKLSADGSLGLAQSSPLVFFPNIIKKNEAAEFYKIAMPTGFRIIGNERASVPFNFSKNDGQSFTIVKKNVDVNIQIFETSSQAGLNFELRSPQSDDNGNTISWNWRLEIDGQDKFVASGSRKSGNPIIWGPAPEIKDVLVLNDQERILEPNSEKPEQKSGPLYPWLDPEAQARVGTSERSFERELVIIGKNLTGLIGETPRSSIPNLSYSPLIKMDENAAFNRIKEVHETNAINVETLGAYFAFSKDDELDVLSTTAKLRSSTNAQIAKFATNESEGEWPLLFGSHFGKVRVVRVDVPSAEDFSNSLKKRPGEKSKTREEIANPLFFRDEILFEVEFDHKPGELPVRISLENAGAEDGVETYREKTVELLPFGNDGKVFRSRRFIVVNSETYGKAKPVNGSNSIDTYPDVAESKILAWQGDELLRPRLISTQTAPPLPDTLVLESKTFVEGNFLAALNEAASCYPNAPKIDWDTVSARDELDFARTKATTLTPGFFLTSKYVDISYGQHAAMLMLRDAYLPYMQQTLDMAKTYIDQDKLVSDKMEQAMNAMARNLPTPIGLFPSDSGYNFHQQVQSLSSYTGNIYQTLNGVKQINPAIRRLVAARMPILIDQMQTSIDTAQNTKHCDVEGLLLITGTGFKNIVEDLQTKVVRYETDPVDKIKKIRPDMAGRRSLEDIYIYRDIYDKYGDLSNAWVSIYKLLGALATVGAAEVGALGAEAAYSAKTAAVLGIGISAADLGYTIVDNYQGYQEDKRRLNFARGASVRFGQEYLQRETAKTTNPLWRMVDIAGSGIGAGNDITQILGGGNLISKGVQNARSITKNGLSFRRQADEILDAANTSLSKYGKVSKKSELENFRTIAEGVGEKLVQDPSKVLSELTDTEVAAVKELLGTPTQLLTNKFRKVQKSIRETLELPAAGAAEALAGAAPGLPDISDAASNFTGDEEAQGFSSQILSPDISGTLDVLNQSLEIFGSQAPELPQ